MKKLTELVHLREQLTQTYDARPAGNELDHLRAKLASIVEERGDADYKELLENLVADVQQVQERFEHNQQKFNSVIDVIDHEIMNEGTKFFSENYSLEITVDAEATGIIRNVRVLNLSAPVIDEILGRIQLYSSWEYPALEIGCRDGEWTPHLVASDPLYIVEHYREFLDATVSKFNTDYQRRIRPYMIKDQDMTMLPKGQMGFVFCWNYLNYRSLDTVKEYLKSVRDLLRPGGTFMFSYNNGDIPECAGYADNRWMSYIPKSMLIPMCESLGYDIVYERDIRGEGTTISWVEVRKPGRLTTVKADQVMGEIKDIIV